MTQNATRLDVMLLASSHHVGYSDNRLELFHDTSTSNWDLKVS